MHSPLLQGPAATPMALIRAMVLAYQRYGRSPDQALAAAHIEPALLAQADGRITARQMEAFSCHAMQELDDEALGWFSRRLPWGSYGLLCRASLSAPNLGVAIKRWCRHHALLTDDLLLTVQAQGPIWQVVLHERISLGEMRELCLLTLMRYLYGYACWVVDSQIPLVALTLPFAPPPHRDLYEHLFPGPVLFDAAQASLTFDARYAGLALRRDEAALSAMLKRALPLTVLQYRRDRLLVERLRQHLSTEGALMHDAEVIAAALHTSTRTLHRQLQEQGASLQQLKDEARQARAQDLLLRSQRPIKQIAVAVGFQNEKSFSRAFRRWLGTSPNEFRVRGSGV